MSYLVVLDKATVGSSNAVALDFGRALFGPIGGVVFAVFVAVSCFGALNGSIFPSHSLYHLFEMKRIDVHVCTAHPSGRTRRIPPRCVWQAEQIAKDTDKRDPVTNSTYDCVHRRWGWVPDSGQFFGGGVLVILLFNCTW